MGRVAKLVLFLCLLALAGCTPGAATPTLAPPSPASVTVLPPPSRAGEVSLEETLAQRRSVRAFKATPLTEAELGQLLWAAQGITDERGFRSSPSAGALYPLEVYAATADGVYHYVPQGHKLLGSGASDKRQALYDAALHQAPVGQAPAVFVIAAVYARTEEKYGTERGPRYVHLEAGHAAQNLLLEAEALGLGAVPVGAFDDARVQEALGLPTDHAPLYLIPVGWPRDGSP